jgi:hypothetical protein
MAQRTLDVGTDGPRERPAVVGVGGGGGRRLGEGTPRRRSPAAVLDASVGELVAFVACALVLLGAAVGFLAP